MPHLLCFKINLRKRGTEEKQNNSHPLVRSLKCPKEPGAESGY